MSDQRGFTLTEILVVMAMIGLLTGFMVQNFSKTRASLSQSRIEVQDALREAQSLALAGAEYSGSHRCGYGIHFTTTGYILYAGPVASSIDCASDAAHDRSYNAGSDQIVRSAVLAVGRIEFANPLVDIFFQPPDPITYICTTGGCGVSAQQTGISATITMRRVGAACPSSDCTALYVTTSGLITTQ